METINEFSITSLTLTNFKQFAQKTTFEFGEMSYISGDNNKGKSSLADAIAFAFCGVPFWGEKSSDKLIGEAGGGTEVEVYLRDGRGVAHTLIRRRESAQTTITFDTLQIRQLDLTGIFAERDIFLSIFNPLYFIEKIASDGRDFLQKLLPSIEHEQVLATLSEHTRALLTDERLIDPTHYIKKRREQLRELDDGVTYSNGQLDLLKTQAVQNAAALVDSKRVLAKIQGEFAALKKNQFDGVDVAQLQNRKAAITAALSDGASSELRAKLAQTEASAYVSTVEGEISKLQEQLRQLYEEHAKIVAALNGLRTRGICPTCQTQLAGDNAGEVAVTLKKQLDGVIENGKTIKAHVAELAAFDKQCADTFLQFRADDIARLAAELAALPTADVSELEAIDRILQYGKLSEDEFANLRYQEDGITAGEAFIAKIPTPESQKEELAKLEESIAASEREKISVSDLISAAVEYAARRAELSLSALQMDKAQIRLMDVVKSTGEVKDVFRFTYDGRDYRGLSCSNKMRAGLEVADLLRRLSGCNYPTFVDNAESVTSMQRPNGQTLLASVKKGAELSVSIRNEIRAAA